MESFSSLEDAKAAGEDYSETIKEYSKTRKYSKRGRGSDILLPTCRKTGGVRVRFRFQLLLPPLVVVLLPCLWYYIRAMRNHSSLNLDSEALVRIWRRWWCWRRSWGAFGEGGGGAGGGFSGKIEIYGVPIAQGGQQSVLQRAPHCQREALNTIFMTSIFIHYADLHREGYFDEG